MTADGRPSGRLPVSQEFSQLLTPVSARRFQGRRCLDHPAKGFESCWISPASAHLPTDLPNVSVMAPEWQGIRRRGRHRLCQWDCVPSRSGLHQGHGCLHPHRRGSLMRQCTAAFAGDSASLRRLLSLAESLAAVAPTASGASPAPAWRSRPRPHRPKRTGPLRSRLWPPLFRPSAEAVSRTAAR